MTSTVTDFSNLINVNYPVPGVDNDTQGFRTNYSYIQQAFKRAAQEISNLEISSVSLNSTNDFGDNIIKNASLQANSYVVNDGGSIAPGTISIDFQDGNYQQFSLQDGSFLFTVINWPPDGKNGNIRIELTPESGATCEVDFASANIINDFSLPQTYATTASVVWDLWSPDNGSSVYAYELGFSSIGLSDLSVTTLSSGTASLTYNNSTGVFSFTPQNYGALTATTVTDNSSKLVTSNFIHSVLPYGSITLWYGNIASIPLGWALCDGSTVTGPGGVGTITLPDLRNRFIIGAHSDSSGVAVTTVTGSTSTNGGSKDAIIVSHSHTATSIDSGHSHNIPSQDDTGGSPSTVISNGGDGTFLQGTTNLGTATITTTIASTGTSGTNANLPPYYALAYIMKITG